MIRLDPDGWGGYTRTQETCLDTLISQYLGGNPVYYVLGAYNNILPVTNPGTGEINYLIGLEAWISGGQFPIAQPSQGGGFYAGSLYAIRDSRGTYRIAEVNGRIPSSNPPLVSTRAYQISPFDADHGQVLYFGGYDCNNFLSPDTAWVFRGYFGPPTVTSINPMSGPPSGGTLVTVTGTNFDTTYGATTVRFGSSTAVSVAVSSTTSLTCVSPAGTGTIDITVTTAQGASATSSASRFTYTLNSETVSTPNKPTGSASGKIGIPYPYTVSGSTSGFGHPVEYQFDWKGDGSNLSPWGSATQSKTWTAPGVYSVRARARCTTDTRILSNWSDPLSVRISVPDISVTPMTYDFGTVKMKKSKTASFTVQNSGTVVLSISSSKLTGADTSMFTIVSGSGGKTVKPGKNLTLKVGFKPTSKGAKSAKLEITSNDRVTPILDVSLSGTGQ